MKHIAVLLEHVDLFDTLDGLHLQLAQSGLELSIVGAGGRVFAHDLASWCTFATE